MDIDADIPSVPEIHVTVRPISDVDMTLDWDWMVRNGVIIYQQNPGGIFRPQY